MMLQLKSKKKIYLYLIFLLILSTISNNNFSNFFKKTFKIKKIYVSGLSDKQNKKIQEKIKKLNYLNIFSIEKDKITKIIENNNLVEKYKVKIKYPDQLLINLYKTNIIGRVNSFDKDYLIGSNGKKISISAVKLLENVPLVEGKFKINDYVKFIKIINKSDLALNEIESLYFHKNRRWDIKTKNGFLIMLPSKNIHKKLSIANELILNSGLKEFNKIDLRIKNKIITSYE